MSWLDWNVWLEEELERATELKRRLGAQQDFPTAVRVIGAEEGQIAVLPIKGWHDSRGKSLVLNAAGRVARQVGALAVTVTSDARFINVPAFCRYYSITEPKGPPDYPAFDRERRRILDPIDNDWGRLPPETIEDALLAAIKGPAVQMCATKHYRTIDGQMVFESAVKGSDPSKVLMIPDWWL